MEDWTLGDWFQRLIKGGKTSGVTGNVNISTPEDLRRYTDKTYTTPSWARNVPMARERWTYPTTDTTGTDELVGSWANQLKQMGLPADTVDYGNGIGFSRSTNTYYNLENGAPIEAYFAKKMIDAAYGLGGQTQDMGAYQQSVATASALLGQTDGGMNSAEKAEIYEQARKEILDTLTEPADWIKRWEVQNAANPYKKEDEYIRNEAAALMDDAVRVEQELEHWQSLAETYSQDNSYIGKQMQGVAQSGIDTAVKNLGIINKSLSEIEEEPIWMPNEITKQTSPNAPSWLSSYVPSQKTGQAITKSAAQTPSGQQWSRTPSSIREGLRGYTEWSGTGKTYSELLEHMNQMLPRDVAGSGQFRWSAAKQ